MFLDICLALSARFRVPGRGVSVLYFVMASGLGFPMSRGGM